MKRKRKRTSHLVRRHVARGGMATRGVWRAGLVVVAAVAASKEQVFSVRAFGRWWAEGTRGRPGEPRCPASGLGPPMPARCLPAACCLLPGMWHVACWPVASSPCNLCCLFYNVDFGQRNDRACIGVQLLLLFLVLLFTFPASDSRNSNTRTSYTYKHRCKLGTRKQQASKSQVQQ
jgi:hypothetical protein